MNHIVAFAGGVGGAKLAHGLALACPEDRLSVVVNTADDFSLYGLHISPDIDTVTYTLAGLANSDTGWGLAGDTFVTLEMLRRYGQDTWFWLGDKDFATHILRTEALRRGSTLTAAIRDLATALGVDAQILPMCNEPVATLIETPEGVLEFQDYFVRRQHVDEVTGVRFDGIDTATLSPEVSAAMTDSDVMVICPSNPIVSIGPILSVPGLRNRLRESEVPIVAVSPIVGGQALKGPADRMLASMGHEVSALTIAMLYRDFLSGIVIDEQDAALVDRIATLDVAVHVTQTVMRSDDDRRRLAADTLAFAATLTKRSVEK
ncbi:MAG: 2-phospho-L-lactate transferase [Chloroflexota bacterium]|jgi:LPPG:FO 2-phospho-L-lactate transferase|nr:2-phospho-L-lactate transferase [Chloroflexota bacterium]